MDAVDLVYEAGRPPNIDHRPFSSLEIVLNVPTRESRPITPCQTFDSSAEAMRPPGLAGEQ